MSDSAPTTGELAPGTEFAGFRIDGVLGRGAMGVVYRATDIRLQRVVALKVVADNLAADASFRERFVSEARAAAMVEHPGIVAIYAAGEERDTPYIAMRLIQGPELSEIVAKSGRLAPQEALRMLAPIAAALDAAAAAGIVHRDVKPSNILVPEDGSGSVLVDFGIGRIAGSARATRTGSYIGTDLYVAPEQIRGGDVDGHADQYSLACVLYELLAGSPPFERDDTVQILWAHVNEDPPSLAGVIPGDAEQIDAVIARAMAKNPDDRYPTTFAFIDAASVALGLAAPAETPAAGSPAARGSTGTVIAGVPKSVEQSSRGPRGTAIAGKPRLDTVKPASRRRAPIIVVAAVLALALVGGIIAVTRGGDSSATPSAATTTAPPETAGGSTAAKPNTAAAQKQFTAVVLHAGQWRVTSTAPNKAFYAKTQECGDGLDGQDLAACMKPVASRTIYKTLTTWFDTSPQDLTAAWDAGKGDAAFAEKNRACFNAANRVIPLSLTRSRILGDYYDGYATGDAASSNKAYESLRKTGPSFYTQWVTFITACNLPKKLEGPVLTS